MKKILIIVSVCAISTAVFAQGTIQWQAPSSAFIGQTNTTSWSGFVSSAGNPSTSATGVTVGGASSLFYYALLTSSGLNTAPTSLSAFTGTLANSWMNTGLLLTNSTPNGRTSPVGGPNTAAVAANWADGSTQNAILVGWSANLGTTWATALANLNNWSVFGLTLAGTPAFFGVDSRVGTGLTPSTANPGISVIGPAAGLIDGSVATGSPLQLQPLYVVPEPGTLALCALGGASLLMFRRRK